jgi:peptidoglycan/LPS O-acetylase OafA/YrhL
MGGDIYGAFLTWQPSSMIGINFRAALSLTLYFGCAFILATISYVVVERPAITLGRRLLRRQRLSPSPAL